MWRHFQKVFIPGYVTGFLLGWGKTRLFLFLVMTDSRGSFFLTCKITTVAYDMRRVNDLCDWECTSLSLRVSEQRLNTALPERARCEMSLGCCVNIHGESTESTVSTFPLLCFASQLQTEQADTGILKAYALSMHTLCFVKNPLCRTRWKFGKGIVVSLAKWPPSL